MKNFLSFLFVCSFCLHTSTVWGQVMGGSDKNVDSKHMLSFGGGLHQFNHFSQNYFGAVSFEASVGKKWGILYRFEMGPNYVHLPLGVPAGLLALLVLDRESWGEKTPWWFFLIPEGATLQFPVNRFLDFRPYLAPLAIAYYKKSELATDHEHREQVYTISSAGVVLNLKPHDSVALQFFGEYRTSWLGFHRGTQWGFKCAWRL